MTFVFDILHGWECDPVGYLLDCHLTIDFFNFLGKKRGQNFFISHCRFPLIDYLYETALIVVETMYMSRLCGELHAKLHNTKKVS